MERNVIFICFAKILVGHLLISFKDLALKILKQRRAGINTVTMFVIWRPPDEEKKNRLTKNPVLQFVSNYWTGKNEY